MSIAKYQMQTVELLQKLLDGRYQWILQKKLDDGEAGNTAGGCKVIGIADQDGNVTQRYQYAWGINTHALDRRGITVEDCVDWGCVDREKEVPEQ